MAAGWRSTRKLTGGHRMAECPFCKQRAEAEDRFCGNCGADLLGCTQAKQHREPVPVMSIAEVCRRLGSVYYRRGNRREALEAWRRSLELEPEHRETRVRVETVRAELSEG